MKKYNLLIFFLLLTILFFFACGSEREEKPNPAAQKSYTNQKALAYFNEIKKQIDPLKDSFEKLMNAVNYKKMGEIDQRFTEAEEKLQDAINFVEDVGPFQNYDKYRLAILDYLEFNKMVLYEYLSPMVADAKDVLNGVSALTDEDWDNNLKEFEALINTEDQENEKFYQAQVQFTKRFGVQLSGTPYRPINIQKK